MVNFCLSSRVGWVRCRLNFIVPAKVACELFEGCHVFRAKRAFEISCFLTLIGILQEKDEISLMLNIVAICLQFFYYLFVFLPGCLREILHLDALKRMSLFLAVVTYCLHWMVV